MKIKDIVFTKSFTGFYFDDQKAMKAGEATIDGLFYDGTPLTDNFSSIRVPGEAISISVILDNGVIVTGDCAAVQYSGAAGRDPLFLASEYLDLMENEIKPLLLKEELTSFKELATKYDNLKINGKKLHTAIRYGLSQVILKAVAVKRGLTPVEVIIDEYNLSKEDLKVVPVFTQSGDDRYLNADKMILKGVDSLPHALINNVPQKLGLEGEILAEYLVWLKNRIDEKKIKDDYAPIIHVDVYGTIGVAFDNDIKKMTKYLMSLEEILAPLKLRIEGPIDLPTKKETMNTLTALRESLEKQGSTVELVADEWCNTLEDIKEFADNKAGHMMQIKTPDLGSLSNSIEAVLYCKSKNIGAYLGGTCNETNISAEMTANIAVATQADLILGKPGMDVDSGFMIVRNEMERVVKIVNNR